MPAVHVRRERILAVGLVVLLVVGLAGILGIFLIESQFEPQGSLFGLPALIRTCGGDYRGPGMVVTRSEMEASMPAGFKPVILEPTIGSIPLGAPFRAHTDPCDTVVYLQTGPDAFAGYALLGGP